MQKIKQLFIYFILFSSLLLSAQKGMDEEAAINFDDKNYIKAYELYDLLNAKSPKNFEFKFRLGFCALNYPEKKGRAIEIFEDVKRIDKSTDVDYYLAKAYHVNYKFDQAVTAYNLYIANKTIKSSPEDIPLIEDAKLGVVNCNNGKILMSKKIEADIKNLGSPLNTNEEEYVPVISTDESVLIYTYVGENTTGGKVNDGSKYGDEMYYHEDIYISKRKDDSTFTKGEGISRSLNTSVHDAAIAVSPDGTALFLYKSTVEDKGDIYISYLKGSDWSSPERLNANVNSSEWEGSCSITADGRFLYFASERQGGLGGRDLYVCEKVAGDWGPAKNLGSVINTAYNDDAPFIHPDGITLFFSSEGHLSIGGYDIMYSVKKDNDWIEPLTMGIPLNTTEDDRYYVINAKGDVGYFSSNRGGSGGKGGQDIYTVRPGILGEKPVLALLKGSVYVNDTLTEAIIEVTKKVTNESIGPYYANSATGKFLLAVSPGSDYRIKITVPGMDPIEEDISIEKLQKFVEIKKDFHVYSADFANKKKQISINTLLDSLLNSEINLEQFNNQMAAQTPSSSAVSTATNNSVAINGTVTSTNSNAASTETNVASNTTNTTVNTNTITEATTNTNTTTVAEITSMTPCSGEKMPDFTALKGKSLNVTANYKNLLDIAGSMCVDGMVFKVQIAAYRKPDNYKYSHLKDFGNPDVIGYPDGITRFTQLSFKTIKDAEAARQKIIAKGQKDAWITALVDGKRYTLEELILVDFLGKAIN